MRVTRVLDPEGRTFLARIEEDHVVPLWPASTWPGADPLRELLAGGAIADAYAVGEAQPLETVRLLSPVIAPQKIIGVGLNYADHARETGAQIPAAPLTFAKWPNAIVGPEDPIRFRATDSQQVDYEAELAVVIGTGGRDIPEAGALKHVLGYTVCNDISARDAQFADGQWSRAKSFDTFCPLGPWLVTRDEIDDPQALGIRSRVNSTTMQDSSTAEMIFGVAELVSYLSRVMTFAPGDVIATGTPFGVGMAHDPPVYLGDGDVVEVEVDGIGTLRNPVEVKL